MPGGAAAAAAETPVPKEKYERGQKSKPARGGGSKPQTASGERDVSPTATSTSSWTRCGGRTISEWMEADKRDPRLDWKRAETVNEKDDRYLGAPCRGDHNTTNPLGRHANQYKVSYKCVKCELVMLYVPKHGATGKYRQHGPLGPTVGKINFEEITKERRSRAPPTPTEIPDSEDSFEKEGTSEEEETPWVETGKTRATSSSGVAGGNAPGTFGKEFDLVRDSTKRPADLQARRRTPKTSPQGGDPESV